MKFFIAVLSVMVSLNVFSIEEEVKCMGLPSDEMKSCLSEALSKFEKKKSEECQSSNQPKDSVTNLNACERKLTSDLNAKLEKNSLLVEEKKKREVDGDIQCGFHHSSVEMRKCFSEAIARFEKIKRAECQNSKGPKDPTTNLNECERNLIQLLDSKNEKYNAIVDGKKKEEIEWLASCSIIPGQMIQCPEGSYKFIGGMALEKINHDDRGAKEVDSPKGKSTSKASKATQQ